MSTGIRTSVLTTKRTNTPAIRERLRQLLFIAGLSLAGGLAADRAEALTVSEFVDICRQSGRSCEEVAVLQAYVGGALDLIAVLHEQTEYIEPVYCKDPKILFDLATIIDFIEANREGHEKQNAMLLVVRFLEQHGGC